MNFLYSLLDKEEGRWSSRDDVVWPFVPEVRDFLHALRVHSVKRAVCLHSPVPFLAESYKKKYQAYSPFFYMLRFFLRNDRIHKEAVECNTP